MWVGAITDDDPSGFRGMGFSDAEVHRIIQFGNEILADLCRIAPPEIVQRAPKIISLYKKPDTLAKASIVSHFDHVDASFEESFSGSQLQHKPRLIPRPTIDGIVLGVQPGDIDRESSLEEYFRHELLHALIGYAPTRPVEEAIVERLNRDISLKSNVLLRTLPWDGSRFSFSCGIGTDDFVDIMQSESSVMVMTVAAIEAFCSQTQDDVWQLCKELLPKQGETMHSFKPTMDTVRVAMEKIFGKNASHALFNKIPFRAFSPGIHHFIFPFALDKAFGRTLNIVPNPTYLQKRPQWDPIQFKVNGIQENRWELKIQLAEGQICEANWSFDANHVISFEMIAQETERSTNGRVLAAQVEQIECRLGDASCILMPPEKELLS